MTRSSLIILCCFLLSMPALRAQDSIDVTQYKASIRFDLAAKRISGTADLRIRNAGTLLMLHLRDMNVTEVSSGGASLAYTQADGMLRITIPIPPAAGDTLALRIVYDGAPTSEAGPSSWGGCFFGTTTFFMGVGFYAPYVSMMRHWLPSNDIPSDKATFDVTFTVPEGQVVAGSGVLAEVTRDGGMVSYRWVEAHPTATYLFTYAISAYARVETVWNGIPMEFYAQKRDSAKAVSHFSSVPVMMEAFTRFFGPYPFDKVGYCITPIGSMEHQTMISYASQLFTSSPASSVAAHELAHQWWGDWVTPRTFADAWLSEGFATFSEGVWLEHKSGRAAYDTRRKQFASTYLQFDASYEGVHPLYDFPRAAPMSNYPSTIYNKGAAVLAMLRYVMGDSAFFRGLRKYGNAHAYGNAGTDDFRSAMETEADSTLDWFFSQWVMKPGWPQYHVYPIGTPGFAEPLRVVIHQQQDSSVVPFFRMPVDLRINRSSGSPIVEKILVDSRRENTYVFPSIMTTDVTGVTLDPDDYILKTVEYRTVGTDGIPATPSQGVRLQPLYPQPLLQGSNAPASLVFETMRRDMLRLDIHDTLGRMVYSRPSSEFDAGTHIVQLPIQDLPAGQYELRVAGTAAPAVQRFLVAR